MLIKSGFILKIKHTAMGEELNLLQKYIQDNFKEGKIEFNEVKGEIQISLNLAGDVEKNLNKLDKMVVYLRGKI